MSENESKNTPESDSDNNESFNFSEIEEPERKGDINSQAIPSSDEQSKIKSGKPSL